MLQTIGGEQTRDWFVLPCNMICISKIDSQVLTQMQQHEKDSSNSEPRVGAQALPGWLQASKQTKTVNGLVPQSILMWQGVQPSKVKALALKPGPATISTPKNIPLTSFQGNSKLNAMTEISNTQKQTYKYRGKLWGPFLKFGIQCPTTRAHDTL